MGPLVPVLILIVLLLAGGLAAGSVYAAVLVPIAAIILVGSIIVSVWRRAQAGPANPKEEGPFDPVTGHRESSKPYVPHSTRNAIDSPATPEDLLRARQENQ